MRELTSPHRRKQKMHHVTSYQTIGPFVNDTHTHQIPQRMLPTSILLLKRVQLVDKGQGQGQGQAMDKCYDSKCPHKDIFGRPGLKVQMVGQGQSR